MSLGSVFYEPLAIFYRSEKPLTRLSQFIGKRLAIGEEGTGARVLASTLLEANGIKLERQDAATRSRRKKMQPAR
jgi:TRAP-type uncharacterized transport system substrate-binding protein